jgi:hypothetical protein
MVYNASFSISLAKDEDYLIRKEQALQYGKCRIFFNTLSVARA